MAKTRKKKIKKLRARVRKLEHRVAALEAPKGIPRSRRYNGLLKEVIRLAASALGLLK